MIHNEGMATTTATACKQGSTDTSATTMGTPHKKIIILAGPTGVGKSDVALQLCSSSSSSSSNSNGAGTRSMIVSADSVQAYRGVSIGANKPSAEECRDHPHLLINVADHTENYNAAEWHKDALYTISTLLHTNANENENANNHQQSILIAKENEDIQRSYGSDTDDDIHCDDALKKRQQKRLSLLQDIKEAKQCKGYNNKKNNSHEQKEEQPIMPIVVGGTMMYLEWLVHGRPDAFRPTKNAIQKAQEKISMFQQQAALPPQQEQEPEQPSTTVSSINNGYKDSKNKEKKKDKDDGTNIGNFEGALNYVNSLGSIYEERNKKLCGKDWYRLRRTLEVAYTMIEQHQQQQQQTSNTTKNNKMNITNIYTGERESSLSSLGYDVRCFFLCPDDRMSHTTIVDQRCEKMLLKGLLEETTELKLARVLPDMAEKAIGYRQTLEYLCREDAKDDDVEAFKNYVELFSTATRRYAKKQMQWFRRDHEFTFIPVAVKEIPDNKEARTKQTTERIAQLMNMSRSDYEVERLKISEPTKQRNEQQGKKMKFYQHKRHIFQDDTEELQKIMILADLCTNQLQSKKMRLE